MSTTAPPVQTTREEAGWVFVQALGRGSQGSVSLVRASAATHSPLHQAKPRYVLKRLRVSGEGDCRRALMEVRALRQALTCANIVHYHDSFWEVRKGKQGEVMGRHLHIIMNYCDGGDLSQVIRRQGRLGTPFRELQILDWFVQMAHAVAFMHDHHIIHR